MRSAENTGQASERVAAMEGRRGVELEPRREEQQRFWRGYREQMGQHQPAGATNVGADERAVSMAAGAIVGLLGLSRGSLPGLVGAGIGAMMVYRGVTGHCAVYEQLGVNTARGGGAAGAAEESSGIQISTAMTIHKPAAELYRFWRDFANLPRIMEHLESVTVTDERHSHWVAKAPRALGGTVEWDAEITQDEPEKRIAWRSLPGSSIDTAGEVRFVAAPGDRGTEVHVWMTYTPPGGRLGHWLTSLLGENPKRVVRDELHNFQRVMEIGEPLTIMGQPHGTCLGRGKAYRESGWKPMFM